MQHHTTQAQRGFALTELLLATVVIAVLIGAAFGIYQVVFAGANTQSAAQNLATVNSKVREVFGGSARRYTGMTETEVANGRLAPESMLNDTDADGTPDEVLSVYGSPLVIQEEDVNGTADGFSIEYPNVPSEDCVSLVPKASNQFKYIQVAAAGALAGFNQGDAVGANGVVKNSYGGEPLDQATLIAQCNAGGTVDVLFVTN